MLSHFNNYASLGRVILINLLSSLSASLPEVGHLYNGELKICTSSVKIYCTNSWPLSLFSVM